MALADTANLLVKMNLGGNFLSNIGKATTGLNKFDKKLGQTESRAFKAGQQIGTGIKNAGRLAAIGVGFLVSQVALGLNSLIELEKQTAQTSAVIKSTGGAAGVTATEVTRLSEKFENLNATVGDEFIRAGQNMLLTFTNIRQKAFEPALEAVLNMNTAMGKGPEGLTTTAILVGKALNDPIKGATALRRVGVQLNDQQVAQIKTLVKQNNLYGAQQVILAELNKEFGGSFAAQGDTTAGKVAKFTDSVEDLQRALAEALLPTLGNVADALSKTLADPKVISGVKEFGKQLANLVSPANIAEGGRILGSVIDAARTAAPIIAGAASTIGQVLSTAVRLFNMLPKELQGLAITGLAINKLTGGLVTNLAGGLISSVLKQLVSGVVNVRGASVIVTGGAGVPGAGAATGGLGLASKVFLVGEAIGLALLVNEVRNGIAQGNTEASDALVEQNRKWLAQTPTKDSLEKGLAGVEAGILEIARTDPHGLVSGESLRNLKQIRASILQAIRQQANPTTASDPALVAQRKAEREDFSRIDSTLTAMQSQLHADLETAIGVLKTATDPAAIAAAAAQIVGSIRGGAGSADTTASTIADLESKRDAALLAGDKATAKTLSDAIKQIDPFVKGRQWQADQIAEARKIVASNKTTAEKVAALKTIQSDLLSHQRTMAADIVAGLVAVENAVKKNAVGGTLYQPGDNRPTKDDVYVPRPMAWETPRATEDRGAIVTAVVSQAIAALPAGFKNALGGILHQPGDDRPTKDDLFRPKVIEGPRAATPADIEAVLARGRAAGFKPTWESALTTNQRTISRLAEAQLVKTEAVRAAVLAGDTRSELARIRSAISATAVKVPVTNVTTIVNVTAAQVARQIVIQKRYGNANGSRGHAVGTGPLP